MFQESVESAQTQTSDSSKVVANAQRQDHGPDPGAAANAANQNPEQIGRRFSYEIDPDIGVIV